MQGVLIDGCRVKALQPLVALELYMVGVKPRAAHRVAQSMTDTLCGLFVNETNGLSPKAQSA